MNLDETSVCAFLVETPGHGHEVKEGSKVGQAVAGLVVQHGHASDAVPQAQIASIAIKNETVEPQNGMCAIDGEQDGPRRFPWRNDVPAVASSRGAAVCGGGRGGGGAQHCHWRDARGCRMALNTRARLRRGGIVRSGVVRARAQAGALKATGAMKERVKPAARVTPSPLTRECVGPHWGQPVKCAPVTVCLVFKNVFDFTFGEVKSF